MTDERHDIQSETGTLKPKGRVSRWVKLPLKVLLWIVIVVLLIPVALYIPPVQGFVKNIACSVVKKSTGMDVQIDRLHLKFPLDVSLQGVKVIEATGDTMVMAREVVADVRLLPLLHLDVDVKALSLNDGYYRMVSPDSSMIMKIRARSLDVAAGSKVEIAKSNILLDKVSLSDGDVQLYMNVWKQESTPPDTTATPFYIAINQLDVDKIRFGMSMLPTIDTLSLDVNKLHMTDGIIDLRKNSINAKLLSIDGGMAKYIAPTPEYIASHPAPAPDTTYVSPPMTIESDSISINKFGAVYAIKGAKPIKGFDANYIEVKDVGIGLRNFYNCQSTLRLPITRLEAKERSGLQILSGLGLVALSEEGIAIDGLALHTPYSYISATADVPFALMELKPDAPVKVSATASLGMKDITAFMPDMAAYTAPFGGSSLNASVDATGQLSNVNINQLEVALPGVLSLKASGYARNALDIDKLIADINFSGELRNPHPLEKLAGEMPVSVPPLSISGKAGANGKNYNADFRLLTAQGDVVGNGRVGLNSEAYYADLDIRNLNVGYFVPDVGVGRVSASLKATGAGFDPTRSGARTDVNLKVGSIEYNKRTLRDIIIKAYLANHNYEVDIDSPNQDVNLSGHITGTLDTKVYCAAGTLKAYDLDLYALGLTEDVCNGSVDLEFDVTADPTNWLYDITADCNQIIWHLPTYDISLPDGVSIDFVAEANDVTANIQASGVDVIFTSPTGLKNVIDGFGKAFTVAMRQMDERNLDVTEMGELMPRFNLNGRVSGRGLLSQFLNPSGIGLDSVKFDLANDSLIRGDVLARNLSTGSIALDTITLSLLERNTLIDYKLHIGNGAGSGMAEFAQVNLNGYFGSNRLSAYLVQHNLAGQTGYRFGMTAAFMEDNTVSVHFTPLKATIAYMPWTFNDDNIIDYCFTDRRVTANLMAQSKESSLLLMTEDNADGGEDLHLNVKNIHIEDFLQMSMMAPPIAATVDGDVRLNYDGKMLNGNGDVNVRNLVYNKMRVGDFDLGLNAGLNFEGDTQAEAMLKINGRNAMSLSTILQQGPSGLEPTTVDLNLNEFPLSVANAFLGPDVASLSGSLNGKMNMTGSMSKPVLNGDIVCDSVAVYLPIIGSNLTFDESPITVADNLLAFNKFSIFGANDNPLTLNGFVDARDLSEMKFDLSANANNFQLVNTTSSSKGDLFGKLFLTMNADVKGPMSHFDVTGNVNLLGTSDFSYRVPLTAASQITGTSTQDVVKFVNFADSTLVAHVDTIQQSVAMRVKAGVSVSPGTVVNVIIPNSASGGGKVQLSPSGNLNFYRNFMGDMTLNGQLYLGNGFAKYSIPVVGEKNFVFNPQSYVLFNGNILNPILSISATDNVRASVVNSSGNSSMVNFLVKLNITNTLDSPNVVFDLSTDDDLSLQNELQSMSADQRSTQAMNLLITGRYQGAGMKTLSGNLGENMLYSLVESSLNSLASKYVKGVDLSFGIDQYDTATDGKSGSATSYSYQLSKSLFSNRFKIVVGGNYSTDSNADDNIAENLISDISFEYTLKQTNNLTMLARLFRHVGYENILEGEVTETGVGFTMRRRVGDLRKLFKVRWGNKKSRNNSDTVTIPNKDDVIKEIRDSVRQRDNEKKATDI